MCLKDICRFPVQIMLGYQGKIAVLCTWGPDRCLDSLSNSWKVKKLPRWSVASCDLYQLLLLASWQWLTSHSLLLLVGWSKENEFPSWILLGDELVSERAWLCVRVDLCLALACALGTCREGIVAYWLLEAARGDMYISSSELGHLLAEEGGTPLLKEHPQCYFKKLCLK